MLRAFVPRAAVPCHRLPRRRILLRAAQLSRPHLLCRRIHLFDSHASPSVSSLPPFTPLPPPRRRISSTSSFHAIRPFRAVVSARADAVPPAPMPCVGVDECPSSGPWSKKPSTAAASGGAVEASMGLASGDGAAKTSTADASAPPCEELPSAAAIFHCRISHRYGVPSSVAFLSAVSPYSADE